MPPRRCGETCGEQPGLYRIAVYSWMADGAREITVLQLPKFKAEAAKLIGVDGLDAVAVYPI